MNGCPHPSTLRPSPGLRSFLRPLLSLSLARLARSFSLRPPLPTLFVSYVIPTTLPYLSPGPPPPPPSLSTYLSIYLSSEERFHRLRRAAGSRRRSRARHTVAVCPLSLQSHPLYSRLLLGAGALPRERFNGCLTLSPEADPFALSARVEISRGALRAFSVRGIICIERDRARSSPERSFPVSLSVPLGLSSAPGGTCLLYEPFASFPPGVSVFR